MGQQIGFYMSISDEAQFLDYLIRETHAGVVLGGPQDSETIEVLGALPEPFSQPYWANLYLVLGTCQFSPVPGSSKVYMDVLKSEVIEFDRSVPGPDRLQPGRLWVEFSYWGENGNRIGKSPIVREAFRKLTAHIRRTYHKADRGYYLGPGAHEMVLHGWSLVD